MRIALALLAASACLSQPARPAGVARQWQVRSASAPSTQFRGRLTYDPDRQRIVMFNGLTNGGSVLGNSTWALGATGDWMPICATNPPPVRWVVGLAYDRHRKLLVIAGGATDTVADAVSQQPLAEVWHCDPATNTWTREADLPAPRSAPQLVFDDETDHLVVIGGVDAQGQLQPPLVFDEVAAVWQPLGANSGGPTTMFGYSNGAAYDADHHRIVALADPAPAGSTTISSSDALWALDGNGGWTQICDHCTGRPRHGAVLVHIAGADLTLEINGNDSSTGTNEATDGMWVLQGAAFMQAGDVPPGRSSVGAAYDASRDTVVMYGGLGLCIGANAFTYCGETWELVPH